jgi:hypothetical protein
LLISTNEDIGEIKILIMLEILIARHPVSSSLSK